MGKTFLLNFSVINIFANLTLIDKVFKKEQALNYMTVRNSY